MNGKHWILIAVSLALAVGLAAVAADEDGRILRVKRPALVVSDLDRSIAFYRDVVGLELFDRDVDFGVAEGSFGDRVFGVDDGARKRMAMFNTSDEVRGFSLKEVRDMQWTVSQRPRISTVLFETNELAAIEQRLRNGDYTVFKPSAAQSYDVRYVEMGFLDPDGHLITMFEYVR